MIRRLMMVLAVMLLALPVAQAARVAPMVIVLDEAGRGATARIEMTNNEDRQLPLELRVFKGEVSEQGELALTPADEDFMVFPPQTVIEPLSQQVFRIQYLGGEPLDRAAVYYVSLKEIPLPLAPGQSKVQLVMNFNVLVNVVPDGARAAPEVDWIKPGERNGVTGIELRIANPGDSFYPAGRNNWKISGTDAAGKAHSYSLNAATVGSAIGYGLVPAGGARIFFVPTESLLADGTISVELGQ